MKAVRALLVTLVVLLPGAIPMVAPAVAQAPPTTFKADTEAAAPPAGGGDVASLKTELAACRQTVELDKKDGTGMDFLVAAYLALWGILLVFFFMVQVRQSRLRTEMDDLRARLARLGGGS